MPTEYNDSLVSNNRYANDYKSKSTIRIKILDFKKSDNEIKNLNDKVDAIQRSLSTLTHLVSRLISILEKNLEERRYAAIRERERRW